MEQRSVDVAETDCPHCGRMVAIIADDHDFAWTYFCPGAPAAPCGKWFKFVNVDTRDEPLSPDE